MWGFKNLLFREILPNGWALFDNGKPHAHKDSQWLKLDPRIVLRLHEDNEEKSRHVIRLTVEETSKFFLDYPLGTRNQNILRVIKSDFYGETFNNRVWLDFYKSKPDMILPSKEETIFTDDVWTDKVGRMLMYRNKDLWKTNCNMPEPQGENDRAPTDLDRYSNFMRTVKELSKHEILGAAEAICSTAWIDPLIERREELAGLDRILEGSLHGILSTKILGFCLSDGNDMSEQSIVNLMHGEPSNKRTLTCFLVAEHNLKMAVEYLRCLQEGREKMGVENPDLLNERSAQHSSAILKQISLGIGNYAMAVDKGDNADFQPSEEWHNHDRWGQRLDKLCRGLLDQVGSWDREFANTATMEDKVKYSGCIVRASECFPTHFSDRLHALAANASKAWDSMIGDYVPTGVVKTIKEFMKLCP